MSYLTIVLQLISLAFCYAWFMGERHLWTQPPKLLAARPVLEYGSYLSLLVATGFTLYSGYMFLSANRQQILR